MRKEIQDDWNQIKRDFINCQKTSSGLVQVGSVSEDGQPNLTPIGSMFLGEDKNAFFCNRFPQNLNRNIQTNSRVCVIAMNSSKWFWLKSLFKGRFPTCPGIKLYGRVKEKRGILPKEKATWERMVKPFRFFKGYDLLWKDMTHVSDIVFDAYEYLNTGKMEVNT